MNNVCSIHTHTHTHTHKDMYIINIHKYNKFKHNFNAIYKLVKKLLVSKQNSNNYLNNTKF